MLDVFELCTEEIQEKMLPIRSKFTELEDETLEQQQKKVRPLCRSLFIVLERRRKISHSIVRCKYQRCTDSLLFFVFVSC